MNNDDQPLEQTPDIMPETTLSPEQTPDMAPETPPVTPSAPIPPEAPVLPPAQVVTTTPSPQAPAKKKPAKLVVGGIIAGVFVVLGAGSALAYTQWYQNPDKVVHDAIINAVQAKSVSMDGNISYKSKDVDVKVTLDSKSKAPNGELNAKASISVDTTDFKHTFDANGSARVVGDTVYVKLSGIQKIVDTFGEESDDPIPGYVTTIVKKIDDKWLSIKASDYEDVSKEASEQQKCLTNLSEKMHSDKAMMDEVTKLYKEHQIITVKQNLGSKTINGTGSLGYEVEANKDAAVRFVKGLKDTKLGKELTSCNKEVDFDDIANDLGKETEKNKATGKVELWVSRFGHEITEVRASGNQDDDTLDMALRPIFNKEVAIEAPKDATSLKSLMDDIQNAIMESYMSAYTSESGMYSDDMMSDMMFQAT